MVTSGKIYRIEAPLAGIYHTNHLRKLGSQMDTASASNCSSGSMKHTAVVAIHHLR
ncbi:MAG: hypothetical protein K9M81_03130 [Chthoniobacterales bacterium]|nr:hypothetical protein [Chthoniobacterales bacterium]